ncbi:MAG: adenylate/guanylate cyclase domain-containing protein [Spirochaetota bacterium]
MQSNLTYRIVELIPGMKYLLKRGGIKLKWTLLISFITVLITSLFGLIFNFMSAASLENSSRQLCLTIAGNISSSESIITAEKKTFKRSVILQDIVSGLSKSGINGFEYAIVYDTSGKLVEKKEAYAAHTDATKRATLIPRKIFGEILKVNEFREERIVHVRPDNTKVPCYRYRVPFNFFDVRVGVIEVAFSEESILGPLKTMRLYIIMAGAFMLLCGIFISILAARKMVRPIKSLSSAIYDVRSGNLDVKIDVNRHDEIGDLEVEFNNFIVHLREKLQMQKFVSESTISMIKKHSKTGEIALGGTRENKVFLFSDIRGFTAMSEKLEPEEVVKILNKYLDLQAQIIKDNHGDIDKFVGDEVMAVFDGPRKTDNAINAAIEIVEAIRKFNNERMQEKLHTIEVGIGINGGEVVYGRMGSQDRMDNTCIGDAVNLSARLCSHADGGSILITKKTAATADKGKFLGKRLDPIRVKGKVKPVEIYQITGKKG